LVAGFTCLKAERVLRAWRTAHQGGARSPRSYLGRPPVARDSFRASTAHGKESQMTPFTSRRFARPAAVLAAALVAGVATAPAQAHTLTESSARSSAAWHGQMMVDSPNTDYISYKVEYCKSLYPHIVECKIGFDNRETKPTSRYACAELIQVFYKAHSEIPQSNPKKFYKHVTHEC
jgi:hypothetical protein